MTTTRNLRIGQKISLPDGTYGAIVRIEDGVEYDQTVKYVTVVNSLGNEVTRWVR
jgi:hypothetical protein